MKEITLQELQKVRESYLAQQQEARNRIIMIEGAIQSVDNFIKFMKDETTPVVDSK
jgi:hypothetical protein